MRRTGSGAAASADQSRRANTIRADEVAGWMKEGQKAKAQQERAGAGGLLDMSLDQLFHVEPSRRGQRRASLFRQRMEEAAAEDKMRKGKGYQDLWEAARVGNMDEIMNKLFRQKGFVASQKDLSHGIHAASVHGREDVIDILIRHGANPSDDNITQRMTPLMMAASKGHVHAMLLLIDRGAKIDAQNDMGQTALHIAAQNGHAHAVKCLVAEGAESWHKDQNGCTPMDCAKSDSDEHERCRLVLGMARPKDKVKMRMADTEDVDGETPAHHYLVDSVFGLARACANNGLDAPTNLA